MPFSCEFNSDFNNDFAICAPVAVAEPSPLRGTPVLPGRLRRLRSVELSGAGSFAVIGATTLTADKGLSADVAIRVQGVGLLSLVQDFTASADVPLDLSALLSTGVGLEAELGIGSAAFGQLRCGFALVGEGSQPFAGLATAALETGLRGTAPVYALLEGGFEVDDEETALFLLGLPSEIGA